MAELEEKVALQAMLLNEADDRALAAITAKVRETVSALNSRWEEKVRETESALNSHWEEKLFQLQQLYDGKVRCVTCFYNTLLTFT